MCVCSVSVAFVCGVRVSVCVCVHACVVCVCAGLCVSFYAVTILLKCLDLKI